MPTPSITIEPREGGGPIVQLIPCEGVTVTMTMPAATRVFEERGIRGLIVPGDANRHSLSIHEDGTLEYDSPTAEYSLVLPRGLADELYAAFQGQKGKALEDDIDLEAAVEENPGAVEGGRKHRSKKQTCRRRKTLRR